MQARSVGDHRRPRGYPAPHNESGRAHLIRPTMVAYTPSLHPRSILTMIKLVLWLNYKYCGRFVLNVNSALAVLGVTLAVASLVVSMAVVNGYFNTLKKTVTDATGHVVVLSHEQHPAEQLVHNLQHNEPHIVASLSFRGVEAVASSHQNISGVLIEGVEADKFHTVLNYTSRLQQGELNLQGPRALIGKALAHKLQLNIGDPLRLVVPQATAQLSPYVGRLKVGGILDLGRHDYNSRYVIVSLKQLQSFVPPTVGLQGVRLRLSDADKAPELSHKISQLGYTSYHWWDKNKNLFQAAVLEKRILFFILLVLMLAASFNVSSTLYVNVMQRWRDISVMKVLGAQQKFLWALFSVQALFIASLGLIMGFALGQRACYTFMWAQKKIQFLPGQVYKLDYLQTALAWGDGVSIALATLLICWLAALWPAYRGSRMLAARALSYD